MYGLDNICKSGIWACKKNLYIEKIIFKDVKMKLVAMHINNKKLSFDIFTVQNIFMEHDLNIWFLPLKKIAHFDPLLAIAKNIAVLLMTGFVLQGHN